MNKPTFRPVSNTNSTIVTQITSDDTKQTMKRALGEGFVELSDLAKASEREQIGIVRAFGQQMAQKQPTIINALIDEGAVFNIDPREAGIEIVEQVAGGGARILHIDSPSEKMCQHNTRVYATVNRPLKGGDIIANDPVNGSQLMVDPNGTCEHNGDGTYRVKLQLTNDRNPIAYAAKSEWENQYFEVIGNHRGEFDTNASAILAGNLDTKTIKRLFRISDAQLIECGYSDRAGTAMVSDGYSEKMNDDLAYYAKSMEGKSFIIGEMPGTDGKGKINKAYCLPAINYALVETAMQYVSNALWTNQGVDIQGQNMRRVYAAPGLWHQIKNECMSMEYTTRTNLKHTLVNASNYVFKAIPVEYRVMNLTGGQGLINEVRELYKEYFLESNRIHLDQNAVPNKILTGSDNMNLTYHPMAIVESFLPGIGVVRIKHDPAFDAPSANTRFTGQGNKSQTTNSGIIIDARSDYDMAAKLTKYGLAEKLALKGDYKGSNIGLIKEDGTPLFSTGYEKGRSVFGGEGSSKKFEHSNYATANRIGATIIDKSAVIMISKIVN